MSRRRIAVVVTARASYARVKTVLEAIRAHHDLELQLIVGASAVLDRYGDVDVVMRRDGFEPVATVYMVLEGEHPIVMAKTTGLGIIELASIFDMLRPDIVVTVADRYETIATAIAASYQNIPVAHLQGGEVTGSIDEKVRHAVTKLANLHFASTAKSAERIVRMGENPSCVFHTGCPSIDLAARVLAMVEPPTDAFRHGVGDRFDLSQPFLIILQHPVTTEFGDGPRQIAETVKAVAAVRCPAFWFWPNVDAGSDGVSKQLRIFRETEHPQGIHFLKNLPPEEFLALLARSACIIGNSSAGIREGAFLGTPAVNIGPRQAGREMASNVTSVPYDAVAIEAAIRRQLANGRYPSSMLYGDGSAGRRVADRLATVSVGVEKKLHY